MITSLLIGLLGHQHHAALKEKKFDETTTSSERLIVA
jgi:hypothetical protein